MADNLNKEEEDLLQSALSDAFAPAPITKVSSQPAAAPVPAPEELPSPVEPSSESAPPEEEWKAEYEEHLAEWKARSAEQRQKAEAERAKWEAVRVEQEKAGIDWKDSVLDQRRSLLLSESSINVSGMSGSGAESVSGWESVRASESRASPSPADARDLVAGERPRHVVSSAEQPSTSSSPPDTHSHPDSEPDSSKHDKWEEIPSEMSGSFPSMTIPSDPHSPTSSHLPPHSARDRYEQERHHVHRHHDDSQGTATTTVFDTRLSTKTRALALVSSLAINLFLPFVNGVMLGFGEIFAKNILVGWLGWKVPGTTVATNVGIRARSEAVGSNPQPRYKVEL